MTFDWAEYLSLAKKLAHQAGANPEQEACKRSAVSRAYYAAFVRARNYLRDNEAVNIPPNGQAHRIVRKRFQTSPSLERTTIGQYLDRLRRDRNRADYDDHFPELSSSVMDDLERAERVLSTLCEL